jgi:hypothetical protein
MDADMQERNVAELLKVLDRYGPDTLKQIETLIRDHDGGGTDRPFRWLFRISENGGVKMTVKRARARTWFWWTLSKAVRP